MNKKTDINCVCMEQAKLGFRSVNFCFCLTPSSTRAPLFCICCAPREQSECPDPDPDQIQHGPRPRQRTTWTCWLIVSGGEGERWKGKGKAERWRGGSGWCFRGEHCIEIGGNGNVNCSHLEWLMALGGCLHKPSQMKWTEKQLQVL